MKRLITPCVASIVVLGSAGAAEAVLADEPVVTGPADQFGPAAEGDDWVGWSQFHDPYYAAHIRTADGTDRAGGFAVAPAVTTSSAGSTLGPGPTG